MPILLEKILTGLILPVSLSLTFGLVAALLLVLGRQRLASVMLAISLAVLWCFSTPVIGQTLVTTLERQVPLPANYQKADVAILLWGRFRQFGSRPSCFAIVPGRSGPLHPDLGRQCPMV